MKYTNFHLWRMGFGQPGFMLSERTDIEEDGDQLMGRFLANSILLVAPDGENYIEEIKRSFTKLSLIYPWSRDHLGELLAGSETCVRMIGRDVTPHFRRIMSGYYSSENNPEHFFLDQNGLMTIRLGF